MPYGETRAPDAPLVQVQVADQRPYQYNVTTGTTTRPVAFPSGPHSNPSFAASLVDIGIFKDTLLPSLSLHSSLALAAWAAGRTLDRVEAKDWIWASAQVANAWWSAIGRRVFISNLPLSTALGTLSWPERLLLAGVTAWGTRLTYRVASRSAARGTDDPRYTIEKKQEGYWNRALLSKFLPEAVFQSVICLPFTAPFTHQGPRLTGHHPYVQALAVGVFSAGFALEALADSQLAAHQKRGRDESLMREGVWSIVRHPNYLGDALVHLSFPILLFGSDMLAPIELLAPIANYIFLRYVGGDAENEASQQARYAAEAWNSNSSEGQSKKLQLETYKAEKNAFWPDVVREAKNPWVWTVVACGLVGVVLEEGVRGLLH